MLQKRDVVVIGITQMAAGIAESVLLPNIMRAKGQAFVWPQKKNIALSATYLAASGVAAGYLSDKLLTHYKIGDDERLKRVMIVASTAIAVNCIEAIVVDNITKQGINITNWQLPSFKKFSANLSVLAIAGLAVGFVSDQILSITAPLPANISSVQDVPVLVPKIQ